MTVPTYDGRTQFDPNRYQSLTKMTEEINPGSAVMVIFAGKRIPHKRDLAGIEHDFKPYVLGVILLADAIDDEIEIAEEEDVGLPGVDNESETELDEVEASTSFLV
jgi:hypothetical protein